MSESERTVLVSMQEGGINFRIDTDAKTDEWLFWVNESGVDQDTYRLVLESVKVGALCTIADALHPDHDMGTNVYGALAAIAEQLDPDMDDSLAKQLLETLAR